MKQSRIIAGFILKCGSYSQQYHIDNVLIVLKKYYNFLITRWYCCCFSHTGNGTVHLPQGLKWSYYTFCHLFSQNFAVCVSFNSTINIFFFFLDKDDCSYKGSHQSEKQTNQPTKQTNKTQPKTKKKTPTQQKTTKQSTTTTTTKKSFIESDISLM